MSNTRFKGGAVPPARSKGHPIIITNIGKNSAEFQQAHYDIRIINQSFVQELRTAMDALGDRVYSLKGKWLDTHGKIRTQVTGQGSLQKEVNAFKEARTELAQEVDLLVGRDTSPLSLLEQNGEAGEVSRVRQSLGSRRRRGNR